MNAVAGTDTHTYGTKGLSLGYKVQWGVAALGTSIVSGTYGALLPIFYQDYLGLTARWIAIASTIYAVWNAINDPLFGYITDSTEICSSSSSLLLHLCSHRVCQVDAKGWDAFFC